MSHINFRFYLTQDAPFFDVEKTTAQIEYLLNQTKELSLIRTAIDLNSPRKSISLLCKAKKENNIPSKVKELLSERGIILADKIEIEQLEHEEHEHHKESSHSHSDKKQKKEHPHHHHHHGHNHHEHDNHWLKATLGLLWGVGLLVLAIASFNIPILAYYAITGFTTLMTLYLGSSVYQSAWNALLEFKWNTNTLYSISTLTILGVSIASLFIPGLPMMFEAAPLVLGFWHLGEAIEHSLIGEINEELDVRDCVQPLTLLKGAQGKEISVKKLIPNDMIVVKQGVVIPVDGVLTTEALLYTTRIDGSPSLKVFYPGDEVKAGMRLAEHLPYLEMRVTKTYQNSYLSLIAKNISKANNDKAPVEEFAQTILKYFIPGLLGIALVSGIVIGTVFTPALAIQCVISVLVSACPCALSLITPMAVQIGMKKASEQGIHYNNGKALQAAADIDAVVFDLNGTLTEGKIAVQSLRIDDKKYLSHFALLEAQSNHPTAQIIKSYINRKKAVADGPLEIDAVDTQNHSGIKGVIDGETFIIGNKNMLLANGITEISAPYNDLENGTIYMVRDTQVIGQIALTDPLRKDAIATVKQLQQLGKSVHICTGSDRDTAERYATLLGIPKENICANTVGAATNINELSKTAYIKQLQRKGYKVAMVGDALNDLTAIKDSDLGIAVKSSIGDSITEQYAGIVVQQGLLFKIATAFDVAQKTKDNIFQNLFVSLTYNSAITLASAGLFIAIGFAVNPVLGVALMVLESTIVLANLYRFKQQDVVTAPADANKALTIEELENTTSKILDALEYRAQLQTTLVNKANPQEAYQETKARPLFTPAMDNAYMPLSSSEPLASNGL